MHRVRDGSRSHIQALKTAGKELTRVSAAAVQRFCEEYAQNFEADNIRGGDQTDFLKHVKGEVDVKGKRVKCSSHTFRHGKER